MGTPGQGYRVPKPVTYEQVGIRRMSDAKTPSGNPKVASLLYNCYPVNPDALLDIVGRPGVNHIGTGSSAGLGQLGYQFRRLSGTIYTVVIVNGLMYTVNWAGPALVPVALPGWLTFQTTDKIYATVLADKLIISDGVRKPVSWDGTNFVDLTNCPILFGQPVVHYAKLVGIVKANPVQIVWSEENDPATGYDTQINPVTSELYDNQWILGQTSQDRLYVLMPTEDALYFSRARSWSMITGAIEDDWRSTGVREAVSGSVGCTLPSSCIYRNAEIWFQDRDGFFWYIPIGGQPVPIWEGYRETILAADKDPPATTGGRANLCSMVEWPLIPLVMATVAVVNGGNWRFRILTWDPETKEPRGVWDLPPTVEPTHLAAVHNANELDRVILALDESGHVMVFGTPNLGPWQDQIFSGNVAITQQIKGAELGAEISQVKDFDRITALFWGQNLSATTSIGYTSPTKITSVPQTVPAAALAAEAEIRRTVGIRNNARWVRPEITHSQINEPFRVIGIQVDGYLSANPPKVK
jgi:hypothetical protein